MYQNAFLYYKMSFSGNPRHRSHTPLSRSFARNQIRESQIHCDFFNTSSNSFTMPFDLAKCARKNILKLEPYRCARECV